MTSSPTGRRVFIAAISSDIGTALAGRYRARGCRVAGSHRPGADLTAFDAMDDVDLFACDVADEDSLSSLPARYAEALGGERWTTFVSAVGDLRPIGPLADQDIGAWGRSVHVNGAGQLQLLSALLPLGRPDLKQVCFLVGGGINGPFPSYSAYCLGKVTLVKACELLDDERPDIHAVAIGTGWVATRIHAQTLAAGERAGHNFDRTLDFLKRGETGTTYDDIFDCVEWCFAQKRSATGGRNFSVVHDGWREGDRLASELEAMPDRFKLRRAGNA